MTDAADRHGEQLAYWNGSGGQDWAAEHGRTDRVLAPIAARVIARAAPHPGETVVDIGCGAGTTSAELARRVTPGGRVVGLDVSAPLIDLARNRFTMIERLEFRRGDAASVPLAGLDADLMFSRFGVMFFGDPIAAFLNIRQGMRPGARCVFACWRKPAENPFLMLPLQAAYRHVPRLPQLGPEDPGPFSFADPDRVRQILGAAGFTAVTLDPVDLTLDVAGGGGLTEAVAFATRIGAASRALEGQPDALRRAAIAAIETDLAAIATGERVPLAASFWLVEAQAPASRIDS